MKGNGIIDVMRWVHVLPVLEGNVLHQLAMEMRITDVHMYKIVEGFEKRKWIRKTKIGRHYEYKLNDSGRKMSLLCKRMLKGLDEGEK